MKEFIISDTHFGHKNIIKYCDRPFNTVEEMNDFMVKQWNSVVSNDDIVWHLGDFGMGNQEQIKAIVEKLNGRIYLIKGNHDRHSDKWYYDCGFTKVYDRPVLVRDYFILSHHPRSASASVYGYIYGHIHNDDMYKDYTKNSFCACVERIDYKPIEFDKAIEKMSSIDGKVG